MLNTFWIFLTILITVCWGLPYGGKVQYRDNMVMQTDQHTWHNRLQRDDIMGNGPDDLVNACGGKPVDVYFAFDTSDGSTAELRQQQFYYASELTRLFYLKKGVVRVGAISFGERVQLQFGLGVYSNRNDIKSSIKKIRPIGGTRNTDIALEFFVRRGFVYPEVRINVGQVLILFVTGPSSNTGRTLEHSEFLKRNGVYIYVIKIGSDVNHTEMIKMASTPPSDFVFDAIDYAISESLVSLLRIEVCTDQPAGSTETSKACIAHRPVDVIFAVDEISIGARNSRLILNLIQKIVKEMDNSTEYINVGLLNSRNINFGEFGKGFEYVNDFITKLDSIRMPDNSEMLRKARRMTHQGRQDIQKTLVLFYDDNVDITKRTLKEAMRNKFADKMEIYVVTIGKYVDTHAMGLISSRPENTHLYKVPDYQLLHSKHLDILGLICKGW